MSLWNVSEHDEPKRKAYVKIQINEKLGFKNTDSKSRPRNQGLRVHVSSLICRAKLCKCSECTAHIMAKNAATLLPRHAIFTPKADKSQGLTTSKT